MTPLDLHSERFARTGNIAGEGFRRLLGRPALGLLQTVVREALQNSIDAAPEGNAVEILLRFRTLDGGTLQTLRERVFNVLPPDEGDPASEADGGTNLRQLLAGDRVSVLEIADFNTSGLAGPTHADVSAGGESLDFVNFLRNVGAARDTHQGGGTYGYGKTSLYALSRVSTILADTWTTCDGKPVRRVMGCHLGDAFEADLDGKRRRFTGRHWWGRDDGEGGVDPVEGDDAIELSEALGLPERAGGQTGTTIAIIAPHLEPEEDPCAELAETVLLNFWPRMCEFTPAARRVVVRLEVEGQRIEIPSPEAYPPLDLYAQALRNVHGSGVGEVRTVRSSRPAADLGRLSIVRGLRAPRHVLALKNENPTLGQAHSIALMRPVELVVRYLPGEAFPDKRFEWAGVFICSDDAEIEKAFASAEPPAHDDWSPDMLPKGRAKTFVNVALRELKEAAATYVRPRAALGDAEERGPSVARTATRLGKLLSGISGRGPGRNVSAGGAGNRKAISISAARFAGLEHAGGRRIAHFEADLTNDGSRPGLVLSARPYLVLDGGSTSSDDLPDDMAVALLELSLAGRTAGAEGLRIEDAHGVVSCRVTVPDEAAVGIAFGFGEGDGA